MRSFITQLYSHSPLFAIEICKGMHLQLLMWNVFLIFSLQTYVNLLFWYQFFCAFSGASMIDYWQMIFFNLFFTSLPPILCGILDRDISAETLLSLPELYKNGQNSEVYFSWASILTSLSCDNVSFFLISPWEIFFINQTSWVLSHHSLIQMWGS